MDGKLCPGIQAPPPLKFLSPSFSESPPYLIQKFFTPLLKFWLESQTTPLERVGRGVPTMWKVQLVCVKAHAHISLESPLE